MFLLIKISKKKFHIKTNGLSKFLTLKLLDSKTLRISDLYLEQGSIYIGIRLNSFTPTHNVFFNS